MNKKIFFTLVIIILSVWLVTSCNNQVESRSEIPVFNRLKPDKGKYEEIRRKMVNIEKTALPDKQIEINAYTTDASMDEVQKFYDDNLAGWKDLGKVDQNGITIVRWGTGKTKGFAIYYSNGASKSQNVVLLEQFWK
jgi:hypothetical protein